MVTNECAGAASECIVHGESCLCEVAVETDANSNTDGKENRLAAGDSVALCKKSGSLSSTASCSEFLDNCDLKAECVEDRARPEQESGKARYDQKSYDI